jgi:hypothetical protein
VDGPAGFHVSHGEGVTKFPRRIAAVMLDEVDLEGAGRHGGVFKPSHDGDGAVEVVDGLGSRSSPDFHLLFGLSQESVNGAGAVFFELSGKRISHVVLFSQSDEVKVLPEEGGEQLRPFGPTTGPVEVFPQQFEHFCDCSVIVGLVDPLFPAFFNDHDLDTLTVQHTKLYFPDAIELEDSVFPAFSA